MLLAKYATRYRTLYTRLPHLPSIKPQPPKVGKLSPITVTQPFELVGWDLVGPFPISKQGNKYILVITEYLTRWCETEPLPDTTASTVANVVLRKVIFPHGCPLQLLSDQGPQFRSEVMQILSKALGINQLFTTPYHP